jgi:hypothetical protein
MCINEKERNERRDLIFKQTYEERCPICGCLGWGWNCMKLRCSQCDIIFCDPLMEDVNKDPEVMRLIKKLEEQL